MARCNKDCFNCPYDDCILGNDSEKPSGYSYYQKYKSMGLCTICKTKKAEPGRVACSECSAMINRQRKERREYLRSQNRCTYCGGYTDGKTTCYLCREYLNGWRINRREKLESMGLCTKCGKNPPAEGRRWCEECLEYQRQKQKRYREKIRARQ